MSIKPRADQALEPAVQRTETKPGPKDARLGWLVAVDDSGQAWVAFEENGRALGATLALGFTREELEHLISTQQRLVVCFDADAAKIVAVVGKAASGGVLQCDADGQRVNLTGEKEVVIACGKASITLRANGRVIIRGTHIESYSEGTNRIKGGQVRIN